MTRPKVGRLSPEQAEKRRILDRANQAKFRARNPDYWKKKRAKANASVIAPIAVDLLQKVRGGMRTSLAAHSMGVSVLLVRAVARDYAEWSRDLDEAERAGRDASIKHGTPGGSRKCGWCPECRAYIKMFRKPWKPRKGRGPVAE